MLFCRAERGTRTRYFPQRGGYAPLKSLLTCRMISRSRRLVLATLTVLALTFGGGALRAADNPGGQAALNDGYSLFYDFCNQESEFSLLLWFKSAPHDVADYATRISATAKDDMATLKKFAANDSALRLDQSSLPGFEVDVRASMAADRKQQLVWGSFGAGFAQAVCMTQSDVTNYGLHVAKVLSETEPDPDRARAMGLIYKKWLALHAEAYRLNR